MMKLIIRITFISFLLLFSSFSFALTIGDKQLNSTLNKKLDARVDLLNVRRGEADSIRVMLASSSIYERMGVDYSPQLENLLFTLQKNNAGNYYIQITSDFVVTQPFFTFLVEFNWNNGRLLREFTLFMDPPIFLDENLDALNVIEEPQAELLAKFGLVEDEGYEAGLAEAALLEANLSAIDVVALALEKRIGANKVPVSVGNVENTKIVKQQVATQNVTQKAKPPISLVYGKVKKNDVLWRIADKMRPANITIEQMMLALQKENPKAFQSGNLSSLELGSVLRIRDVSVLDKISPTQARLAVARQNDAWAAIKKAEALALAAALKVKAQEEKAKALVKVKAEAQARALAQTQALAKAQAQEKARALALKEAEVKAKEQQALAEKAAIEKIEKAAIEKARIAKALEEKALVEKALAEKIAAEKVLAEKAALAAVAIKSVAKEVLDPEAPSVTRKVVEKLIIAPVKLEEVVLNVEANAAKPVVTEGVALLALSAVEPTPEVRVEAVVTTIAALIAEAPATVKTVSSIGLLAELEQAGLVVMGKPTEQNNVITLDMLLANKEIVAAILLSILLLIALAAWLINLVFYRQHLDQKQLLNPLDESVRQRLEAENASTVVQFDERVRKNAEAEVIEAEDKTSASNNKQQTVNS